MRRLYAFADGKLVGCFRRDGDGPVRFSYGAGADRPISLSLPLDGGWKPDAPGNLLENLLPDDVNDRIDMADALKAPSTDPFDLLDHVDSAGGLVFSKSPDPPTPGDVPVMRATPDDIEAAARRISARRGPSNPVDASGRIRFSLAGTQGKLTLARVGDDWYWPNAALPSTHIVKPPSPVWLDAVEVEDATMSLATSVRIKTPKHGIERFTPNGVPCYVIERFDREVDPETGIARRLRVEDLAQAMGLGPDEKYDGAVDGVLGFLVQADATKTLAREWLVQYMFRCAAGDADAHLKNFSVVLDDPRPRMSPVYDALATGAWPKADRGLAIPFMDGDGDGVFLPEWLTPETWAEAAERVGIDGTWAADTARAVFADVGRAAPKIAERLPEHRRTPFLESVECAATRMRPATVADVDAIWQDLGADDAVPETPGDDRQDGIDPHSR